MVLDQGTILITRGSKNYRLQLQDYPALAAFIDSIRGTLAGDAAALQHNYILKLQGAMAHWTLQLLPANEQIKAVVQRISISGEKGEFAQHRNPAGRWRQFGDDHHANGGAIMQRSGIAAGRWHATRLVRASIFIHIIALLAVLAGAG